jgi:hypothetical protein
MGRQGLSSSEYPDSKIAKEELSSSKRLFLDCNSRSIGESST